MKFVKRWCAVVVLTQVVLCAWAQRGDIGIYIAPTTGGTQEDQAFFNENFEAETIGAGYKVVYTKGESDYYFTLEVQREDGSAATADTTGSKMIRIVLYRTEDNYEVITFAWPFATLEEMYQWNLYLVYQAMANVSMTKPAEEAPPPEPIILIDDAWRNKWIYVTGYAGFPQFRLYLDGQGWTSEEKTGDAEIKDETGFLMRPWGGVGVEFQYLDFMSVEAALEAGVDAPFGKEGLTLDVDLLIKFPLKPPRLTMSHLMIEPYLGLQINMFINEDVTVPVLTADGGLQVAMKVGPRGGVFFDFRVGYDLPVGDKYTTVKNVDRLVDSKSVPTYWDFQRVTGSIGIGYKVGFLDRPVKAEKPKKVEDETEGEGEEEGEGEGEAVEGEEEAPAEEEGEEAPAE